ncbi:hypothetical protein OH77DRAFT_1517323 [Trametes cingulata]|nr:hypothetical protein OH77DRAFT_1517323 [Trametes cingulata]
MPAQASDPHIIIPGAEGGQITQESHSLQEDSENDDVLHRRLIFHGSTAGTERTLRARLAIAFDGQGLLASSDQAMSADTHGPELARTFGEDYDSLIQLWIQTCPRDSQNPLQPLTLQVRLPTQLDQLRQRTPHSWNQLFDEVAEQYGDRLSRSQWDAITALCYTYRWFGGVAMDANVVRAWNELGEILECATFMCLHLGTSAQDAIRNVALWTRARIPEAYPPGTRIWGMAQPRLDYTANTSDEDDSDVDDSD